MSYTKFESESTKSLKASIAAAEFKLDQMRAELSDSLLRDDLASASESAREFYAGEFAARMKWRARIPAGYVVGPGPWMRDLDNYPDEEYVLDAGNGYKIHLRRQPEMFWNVYVVLPAGHPAWGHDYDSLTSAPLNITYSGQRPLGWTFGIDHATMFDSWPAKCPDCPYSRGKGSKYTTYDDAVREGEMLVKYFLHIAELNRIRDTM